MVRVRSRRAVTYLSLTFFFKLFVLKQVALDLLLLNPLFRFGLGLRLRLPLNGLGLAVFEDFSQPGLSLLLGDRAEDRPIIFAPCMLLVHERLQGLILVDRGVERSEGLNGSAGPEEVAQVLRHVLLALLAARHEALPAAELKFYTTRNQCVTILTT